MNKNETEIKLKLESLEGALVKLQTLHAMVKRNRHFEDNLVLDTEDLSLRQAGNLLRIRLVDSEGFLTFKGPMRITDGIRQREELESHLKEPQIILEIFERLGYKIVFRYQKYRTVYQVPGRNVEVCLDETPIGNFFELEGDMEVIHETARALGYDRKHYITASYAALYFQWCRENGRQPAGMTF